MTGDDVPGENATRGRRASPGRNTDGIMINATMKDDGLAESRPQPDRAGAR